jgi:AraC-like DNA-binding protein
LRAAAELGRAFFLGILEKKQILRDEELWRLTRCGLDILSTDVKEGLVPEAVHVDIVGMHLGRVQRCIYQHLSLPGLSVDRIAAKCGISRRYVHQLMREGGITFSRYLWEARLTQADAWIRSLDCRFMRLESIAAQAGFKSASHFSRMYRRRYGCSPREAREAALGR